MGGARAVLEGVLSQAACQELLLIARSLAVRGYREGVCSATIFEVAAALPEALPLLVTAREAVVAAVEAALGLELGLLVEFTGLIGWRPGSFIGWHHDANRPYLQQRTHSAVCYLQHAGTDFTGGTFLFQCQGNDNTSTAAPQAVLAAPGRVVAYDAQDKHSVEPVSSGERYALTLWFTEDPQHSEDSRLLAQLAGPVQLPLPATMWLLPDGVDLRLCRLAMAGLALVCRGRLLYSAEKAEEEGARLQLAVQPNVLQAWLDWHGRQHSRGSCSRGTSPPGAAAAAAAAPSIKQQGSSSGALQQAVLLEGIEFYGVQEAVLAVQRWSWRRCPDGWGRERVCCTHLNEAPAQHPDGTNCGWLRCCQLCTVPAAASLPMEPEEMQAAVTASHAWFDQQRAALRALRPRWVGLGALFAEPAMLAGNEAVIID